MRLVLLFAILDDMLLFVLPAAAALLLYILDVIPLWAALVVATPFLALAIYVAARIFRERPVVLPYVGGRGVAVEDLKPEGVVKVSGEYWKAVCLDCEAAAGTCVEIVEIKNGRAYVRPCQ
ncbi:MAG: NfeD family protein [Pyrobaculum sp.]